jgi:hypothetical protein
MESRSGDVHNRGMVINPRKCARSVQVFAVAAALSSCVGWKARADELRQSADELVEDGHSRKDDFVRRFGTPTSCSPLPAGESCSWSTSSGGARSRPRNIDVLQVRFDLAGKFVSDTAYGERIYQGRSAPEGSGSTFGDCPLGQSFNDGSCSALDPLQGVKSFQ